MSRSSREPTAYGKPDAMFSFLEVNRDHLLSQARFELVKQEHQVGHLKKCVGELQRQAYAQRLESQDAHHGKSESRRV